MLKHQPGTLTGDNEGVKFFAIYGIPVLWVQVKTYASAFGIKRMSMLQENVWACERV